MDNRRRLFAISARVVVVPRHRAVVALLAVVGLLLVVAVVRAGGIGPDTVPGPAPGPGARSVAAAGHSPQASALRVLHAWDERRAAAYASSSPGRLRDLYVPRSSAGAADVRLLERYRDRALRITGMRTQVLSLVVLDARPGHWRVRVSDRLVGAVAVREDHRGPRQQLPRDTVSTRVVELVRADDGVWRVAAVQEDPAPG